MTVTQTTVQKMADTLRAIDQITDRVGTPITTGAIVTVYPKAPWAQSMAGKVGKATLLLDPTSTKRPVCVIIPGECGLFQWAADEVEVDLNPTVDVTYSGYWPRDTEGATA